MALSQPQYTMDSVWAQNVTLFIAGTANKVGAMQSADFRVEIPQEIMGATDGKSRLRRTGPIQVRWTARRILMQKQTIIDMLGTDAVSDQGHYGNYNWDQLIFDIVEMYQSVSPAGVVAKSGGWTVKYATVTEWGVGHGGPYEFWMEDLQGIGLGFSQQPWT